ncbi:hypothetical protein [Streptomyces cellulosae]|uniref:Transposase n=1 Tax=Streptomyces cellulosae TaxID=1968 RepID=A0ABW7Y635_STRCE
MSRELGRLRQHRELSVVQDVLGKATAQDSSTQPEPRGHSKGKKEKAATDKGVILLPPTGR